MLKITIENLPKKGLVMAYFREKLLFSPYEVEDGKLKLPEQELFEKEEPYECHFFDDEKEYRLIKRSARKDVIERILTSEEEKAMPGDLLFAEDVLVKTEYAKSPGIPEKLRVINRYRYSENDTLVLKDYRMATDPIDASGA